jgi:hypothetical protein
LNLELLRAYAGKALPFPRQAEQHVERKIVKKKNSGRFLGASSVATRTSLRLSVTTTSLSYP